MTKELAKQWVIQLQTQIDNNEEPLNIEWPCWFPKRKQKTQEEHMADSKWLIGFLNRNYIETGE